MGLRRVLTATLVSSNDATLCTQISQSRQSTIVRAVTSNDIKNGLTLQINGEPWRVQGALHMLINTDSARHCTLRLMCCNRALSCATSPACCLQGRAASQRGSHKHAICASEFLHVKPGKGAAFVRSKVKNLVSGTTMEKTFRAGEALELADVNKQSCQFTYAEVRPSIGTDPFALHVAARDRLPHGRWRIA